MRYLYILLALVYITQSHAQTSNIVGQVINKDSVAIEGVAIILQKQDSTFIAGTITDKEGRFTLPMTEKPYRLMFQHLAYEAMCLNSSKEQIGNIILKESMSCSVLRLETLPDINMVVPFAPAKLRLFPSVLLILGSSFSSS